MEREREGGEGCGFLQGRGEEWVPIAYVPIAHGSR